jgi:hypothetical protein
MNVAEDSASMAAFFIAGRPQPNLTPAPTSVTRTPITANAADPVLSIRILCMSLLLTCWLRGVACRLARCNQHVRSV